MFYGVHLDAQNGALALSTAMLPATGFAFVGSP